MSDKLIHALEEQGFTKESALEYLKGLAATDEAKKEVKESGDPLSEEKLRNIINDVVGKQMEAISQKRADTKDVNGGYGEPDVDEVKSMQSDIWLLGQVLRRHPSQMNAEVIAHSFNVHHGKGYKLASVRKALDTTDASSLVPTDMARQMLADVEAKSIILANIPVINMPTNPWEAPYQSASMSAYGVDESTSDDASAVKASDLTPANITYNAKKVGARALWSRELDEDSAIAILPMIRADFVRVIREAWERNFVFGDETATSDNINIYGGSPTTTAGQKDPWLQTDGLVHHCLVTNTDQASAVGAAISGAKFMAIRALLGKYGDNPQDLLCIVNRDLYYDMVVLDEVKTIEKYGMNATILTGELARFYGTPVLISDGLPKTAAAGYIDASSGSNTKKSFILVNRVVGASVGRRNEMRIAVDTINKTDQYEGVVFSRFDIQMPFVKGVAYGYNIT